jgi:hypothetical protein
MLMTIGPWSERILTLLPADYLIAVRWISPLERVTSNRLSFIVNGSYHAGRFGEMLLTCEPTNRRVIIV